MPSSILPSERSAGQKDRSCGTCEFFDPRRPKGGLNEDSGICRIKPPTVSHVAMMKLGEDGESYATEVQVLTHWPAVDPRFDWCVEYRQLPRDARPATPSTGSSVRPEPDPSIVPPAFVDAEDTPDPLADEDTPIKGDG